MIYSEQSEDVLVSLTLAGDQRAYEALVLRCQKAVCASAYSVVRSSFMAEDAAQDAFVTAWMKLNVLREPSKFCAWVCRIAKNCAKNMLVRFREYIDFDALKDYECEHGESPEEALVSSDEKELLRESVGRLPDKVKQVICLHYFEGLSIAEIADRLRVPAGTVKWQLHDGRRKIRKDLCAMDEKENDTLVERVMKKVEELRLWRLKSNKDGFAAAYANVLGEVESLPESADKDHAMADVLMLGWWWLPGEKNDALFARIKAAAESGGNDEVMEFIVGTEDEKLSGKDKIEFMRDRQIPRLEAGGLVKALGREWFWLGYEYYRIGDRDAGFAAYDRVLAVLKPSDVHYANALAAIKAESRAAGELKDVDKRYFSLLVCGEEYRFVDGNLRFWSQPGYGVGELSSVNAGANYILYNASMCDGYFFKDGMRLGEFVTGSDGSSLTYAEAEISVKTPFGAFEGCQLWVTRGKAGVVCRTYYKRGVGIVRQETEKGGYVDARVLKEYKIAGGDGLLPCAAGNRWVYTAEYDTEAVAVEIEIEMRHADGKSVTASHYYYCRRFGYDENSWDDMMLQMRSEYCRQKDEHNDMLCDVSQPMERAEALAKTSLQIAHTKAACAVMRRIFNTDPEYSPGCAEKGHWNFFCRKNVTDADGGLYTNYNRIYNFEWKDMSGTGDSGYPLLYSDILGILQDAAGYIWSDEWKPGFERTQSLEACGYAVETALRCESAGTVKTAAGVFEGCICLSLDIKGMKGGYSYRGGRKEYFFAPGVGTVRAVSRYKKDTLTATYELTEYSGGGKGYMPVADGMMRRYEAIGLADGYAGSAEYTYFADGGGIVIFENRSGVRKLG